MKWSEKAGTPQPTCRPLKPGQKSWHVEVADRLAKKEAAIAAGTYEAPEHQCQAMTSGKWGPKRRCEQSAMRGTKVCWMHGGSRKAVRRRAELRILAETDATIARLVELRDQDADLKVSLGATIQLKNEVLAPKTGKVSGTITHQLVVGSGIGAMPASVVKTVKHLPAATQNVEDDFEDAEILDDEAHDEHRD